MSETLEDTQPVGSKSKPRNFRSVATGLLGLVVLILLGAFAGYSAGIGDRKAAEGGIISQQLAEQYQAALVDMQFGRYEAAKQRLEFIINHDPNYAGAAAKLTEVLVISSVPTPVTAATAAVAAPGGANADGSYQIAVQYVQAQDWPAALTALDQARKLDAAYKAAQVDGMYFFTLRNYGVGLIGQGNLEGGIYHITLAERFGTLDNTAYQLRDNARFFVNAASFWELDWRLAAEYFSQLASTGLWDGTMTAAERYHVASMRYADSLFNDAQYCAAWEQYERAASIGPLDETADRNARQAYQRCYPATAVPTVMTPATVGTPPTEPPTEPPPTEPPTEPPTNPP